MTILKELEGVNIGDPVTYIPYHANGDINHKDCERGFVTSANDAFIFVRFSGSTSQGCKPDQLRLG